MQRTINVLKMRCVYETLVNNWNFIEIPCAENRFAIFTRNLIAVHITMFGGKGKAGETAVSDSTSLHFSLYYPWGDFLVCPTRVISVIWFYFQILIKINKNDPFSTHI